MQTIPSRKSFLLLSLSFLLFISTGVAEAGPPDAWYHRMMSLYGVTYGQNLFVAVGDGGTIQTSRDGENWGASNQYATFKNLRGVAYGAGLFVAVGEDGLVIISPNGSQWTIGSSQVSDMLWGVTFGNGLFVAVGSMGTIVTSPNGVDWTNRNSKVSESLYGVAYGNGKFVAVGNSGRILTSTNGFDWTPQQVTSYELRGVAYGNNTFKAVGLAGTILSSDTGFSWNLTPLPSQFPNDLFFNSISYGNGIFIVAGKDLHSQKGIIIHNLDAPIDVTSYHWFQFNNIGFGNFVFIAVGDRGTITQNMGKGQYWYNVSSGTDRYLNVASFFKNQLLTPVEFGFKVSRNGITWKSYYVTDQLEFINLWSFASNETTCVVVGDLGTILTYTEEVFWYKPVLGTTDFLFAATYGGNGKFVAMGLSDKVYTSPDGMTWNSHPLGALYWVTGVTYGNNEFVAVGLGGGVLTSPNGENWNFSASGVPQTLNSVAFGKGLFVAVGDTGVILTSVDGTTWTPAANFPTSNNLYSIAFAGDSFFAVGAKGTIVFSEDGTHWSLHHSWTTKDLHGAAWAGSYGIAVGADGTFLQSGINAKLFLPLLLRN